jgi:multimeric flavodoxin WrbA
VVGLALVASPRDGNTSAAAHDLLAAWAGEDRYPEELMLSTLSIAPIGDCARCVEAGGCVIHDDFGRLMERIYTADLLVLATPLYWYGPSATLKLLIDRWSCLLDLAEESFRAQMRGKRAAIVVAQGEQGFYESAPCLQMMEWALRYLDMVVATRVVVVGHAQGDYAADTRQRAQLAKVGAELARSTVASDLLPPWFHVPHDPSQPLGGIFRKG